SLGSKKNVPQNCVNAPALRCRAPACKARTPARAAAFVRVTIGNCRMTYAKSVGMRKTARIALMSMVLASAGIAVTACQSDKDIDITKLGLETDPPELLYNQGLANMKAGNIAEASRKFDSIDRQHPFTEPGRKALVMSTFAKHRLGQNDDAVATGNRYLRQYPNSQDTAYVQYLVGLSYS